MHLSGYLNATLINNNKLKISIELFPDVIKSAYKNHIKLNTMLNERKVNIKFEVIRLKRKKGIQRQAPKR